MGRNYTKTNLIMRSGVGLLALTMISGLVLISNKASAESSAVSTASITVPVACTMTGEGTEHTATIAPNTYSGASGSGYENGIGKTTLTAICNDDNGFSIYAIGYTGNQYEGENHTKLIGQSTSSTISTKAYASGDTTSNWSMKLTKIADSTISYNPQNLTIQSDTEGTFSNWHSVPDAYTKVAEYHANTGSSTTDATLGVKLETTYAAYISSSQPADTYVGQVKYTMVHPYNADEPVIPRSLDTATTMQEVTYCSEDLPEGQVYTLTDTRDNQDYKVARLKDGKCWMVENLNIAGGTVLSSEDTDFESTYTLPVTNGWTVTDGKLVLPVSAIKNDSDNNLTDSTQFSTNDYAYVFNSGNKDNCGDSSQNTPCYSYYSWDAVTLGSGRSIAAENTDADYSICPKNWRLPTSGSSSNGGWKRGDFYTLATSYGANLESNDNDFSSTTGANFFNDAGPDTTSGFLLAGYYMGGSFLDGGSYGSYWSSTMSFSSAYALHLRFRLDGIYSNHVNYRRVGYSVRCLFGS